MTNNPYAPAVQKGRWKPTVLFWIVAAIVLLVLIPFAIAGGVGMAMFILGLVALLTGLYALLFKRRSWVGLPHRKSGGIVAIAGFVALIVGAGVAGATAAPGGSSDKASLASTSQKSATATPTATPTNPANSACLTTAETRKYNDQTLICTAGSDQRLVWMTEADSKRVVAEKAAADKAAADKAAADKAAAEKAAADKAAADAAAAKLVAEQAAAQKAAAEQAAAQQAAKPAPVVQAPAPVAPAPAAAYYANCTAAKAAGAAPLYAGQAGYSTALDRDRDGVACEK
ncbi:excalibur calcium-binding domain-containing protein [Arthrobacter sp. BE255]|uniref:excalibur calcium-binding domain-containing protein n=1 Tax=Arthrobacter sp. BE255 TaxID=2817721 RepID=UPI0028581F87|nr:excalibur calcium-binding domain-containing protein [Arthrobacter sp. BE255]MDR7161880.1 hypothetical protein [Arthrobacter sp. BE255]